MLKFRRKPFLWPLTLQWPCDQGSGAAEFTEFIYCSKAHRDPPAAMYTLRLLFLEVTEHPTLVSTVHGNYALYKLWHENKRKTHVAKAGSVLAFILFHIKIISKFLPLLITPAWSTILDIVDYITDNKKKSHTLTMVQIFGASLVQIYRSHPLTFWPCCALWVMMILMAWQPTCPVAIWSSCHGGWLRRRPTTSHALIFFFILSGAQPSSQTPAHQVL